MTVANHSTCLYLTRGVPILGTTKFLERVSSVLPSYVNSVYVVWTLRLTFIGGNLILGDQLSISCPQVSCVKTTITTSTSSR
jgi:hypothetical protein